MTDQALIFVNVADTVDPDDPQGRSYRQVNAAMIHAIPIGTLVELDNGARLFVVAHGRDCDQTPLYALAPGNEDPESNDPLARRLWDGGHGEENLTVVPPVWTKGYPPRDREGSYLVMLNHWRVGGQIQTYEVKACSNGFIRYLGSSFASDILEGDTWIVAWRDQVESPNL